MPSDNLPTQRKIEAGSIYLKVATDVLATSLKFKTYDVMKFKVNVGQIS